MTNPDNAVGTNAAYGGRTSVNAFNDNLSAYSRGVMSGWACTPSGGLVVSLGGNGTERDVAVAEDNIGNKTSINNISGSPITLTMSAAPGSGTRIDSVVAYVDASPQGEATVTDNYGACGLIVVQGTPSSTPAAPSDNDIRSAITSDGASGPTAYYVVLANINMASGTTDITDGEITAGDVAQLSGTGVVTANNIDFTTYSTEEKVVGKWIDDKIIYKKTFSTGSLPNAVGAKTIPLGISNLGSVLKIEGVYISSDGYTFPDNSPAFEDGNNKPAIRTIINNGSLQINVGMDRSQCVGYITVYYTKSS